MLTVRSSFIPSVPARDDVPGPRDTLQGEGVVSVLVLINVYNIFCFMVEEEGRGRQSKTSLVIYARQGVKEISFGEVFTVQR